MKDLPLNSFCSSSSAPTSERGTSSLTCPPSPMPSSKIADFTGGRLARNVILTGHVCPFACPCAYRTPWRTCLCLRLTARRLVQGGRRFVTVLESRPPASPPAASRQLVLLGVMSWADWPARSAIREGEPCQESRLPLPGRRRPLAPRTRHLPVIPRCPAAALDVQNKKAQPADDSEAALLCCSGLAALTAVCYSIVNIISRLVKGCQLRECLRQFGLAGIAAKVKS